MGLQERLGRVHVEPEDLHALLVGKAVDPVRWWPVGMDGIHAGVSVMRFNVENLLNIPTPASLHVPWGH